MFQLSYSIENPEMDVEIQEIFTSTQLTKKLLCYKLNEKLYKVLLVHNPEKVKLTSTVNFNTSEHGRSSCVASCNKKCAFSSITRLQEHLLSTFQVFITFHGGIVAGILVSVMEVNYGLKLPRRNGSLLAIRSVHILSALGTKL